MKPEHGAHCNLLCISVESGGAAVGDELKRSGIFRLRERFGFRLRLGFRVRYGLGCSIIGYIRYLFLGLCLFSDFSTCSAALRSGSGI